MSYIDGFVAAVPTDNKQKYIEHAKLSGVVFKDHGALSIIEAWGDDIPEGEVTSFPMAVKCAENETVVFSRWFGLRKKFVMQAGQRSWQTLECTLQITLCLLMVSA